MILTLLLACALAQDPSASSSPQPAWTIYSPWDTYDETGRPLVATLARDQLLRSAEGGKPDARRTRLFIVREGDHGTGHPLSVFVPNQFRHSQIVLSDTLAFFAAVGESITFQRISDDVTAISGTRMVVISDTAGTQTQVERLAHGATWAPGLAKLAWATARRPVTATGEQYPEVPDSVTILDFVSGRRTTYPAAASRLVWDDDKRLLVDYVGVGTQSLTVETGTLFGIPITFGTSLSPNREWFLECDNRAPFKIISRSTRGNPSIDSERIMKAIEKRPGRIVGRPFWVRADDGRSRVCFGVYWAKQKDKRALSEGGKFEVLVYEVESAKVVQRIVGSFVGPAAGRQGVFYLHEGSIEYASVAP